MTLADPLWAFKHALEVPHMRDHQFGRCDAAHPHDPANGIFRFDLPLFVPRKCSSFRAVDNYVTIQDSRGRHSASKTAGYEMISARLPWDLLPPGHEVDLYPGDIIMLGRKDPLKLKRKKRSHHCGALASK